MRTVPLLDDFYTLQLHTTITKTVSFIQEQRVIGMTG